MKMIKTDKLVFEYAKRDEEGNIIGKSRAIDEVSLDIEPGQFIAILGHNGSGKSTLAKHDEAHQDRWDKIHRINCPGGKSKGLRSPVSWQCVQSVLYWMSQLRCWIRMEEKKYFEV